MLYDLFFSKMTIRVKEKPITHFSIGRAHVEQKIFFFFFWKNGKHIFSREINFTRWHAFLYSHINVFVAEIFLHWNNCTFLFETLRKVTNFPIKYVMRDVCKFMYVVLECVFIITEKRNGKIHWLKRIHTSKTKCHTLTAIQKSWDFLFHISCIKNKIYYTPRKANNCKSSIFVWFSKWFTIENFVRFLNIFSLNIFPWNLIFCS
jgi:hypothetical protein